MFFPFILPLFEALEVNFFPKDSIDFFKNVTQQTIEARKESGQVNTCLYCRTATAIGSGNSCGKHCRALFSATALQDVRSRLSYIDM